MVICILGLLFMLISCSACLRDPGDMPEASILGFFLAVIGGTMWILIKNDQGK